MGKLADFAVTVVLLAAMMGNVDRLNHWVQLATAKVFWESRASNWGSPIFFPEKKISRR
jgi:hypothetical protein